MVVAVVGITSKLEGEEMKVDLPGFHGGDRTSLNLPSEEEVLLGVMKSTGKPLVVVLMNGSALAVNWANDHANAIVDSWYAGEEGGTAIGVRARDFPGTQGSGFLVPPVDKRSVKASAFSFAKWDWVRAAGEPDGVLVMRCSIGRHREEQLLQRTDDEVVQLSLEAFRQVLNAEPEQPVAEEGDDAGGLVASLAVLTAAFPLASLNALMLTPTHLFGVHVNSRASAPVTGLRSGCSRRPNR